MSVAKIVIGAVDQSRAAFASASKSFDDLGGKITGVTGKLGLVGAGISAAFATLEGIKIINVLDQLDDLQEKTGISVESLSKLRFAGETTGTPFESLTAGIGRLSKQMAAAAGGNKEAIATFDALGVSVTNADGSLRSSDEVLGDLADRFASYADGPEKAALAQRIFGKSGADLIPILNQGKQGLAALAKEAEQLGVVYGADVAKNAATFNDNLVKIKLASEAASIAIAGPLIAALANLSTKFVEAKKKGDLFGEGLKAYQEFASFGFNISGAIKSLGPKPLTTAEIQADVNRRNPNQANAGGGRGIVLNAAPIVKDEADAKKPKSGGGAPKDPLAEAKRFLEQLQKQNEKLRDLTTVEQALLDIQKGRIGFVSPAVEKEILQTARLIDLKKGEADNLKASEEAAKQAADAAGKLVEQAARFAEDVETPFEKLQRQLEAVRIASENNPLIGAEMAARAGTKAWQEYLETIDAVKQQTSEADEFTRIATEKFQDALGDGLFDIANGNFKNIGDSFVKTLNRMAADALAADLARKLFGDKSSGGSSGGFLEGIISSFFGSSSAKTTGDFARLDRGQSSGGGGGGLSSIIPSFLNSLLSFDVGTDFVPQDMVAKIHKGERIIPAAQNKPGFGGSTVVNQTFTVSGQVDRNTQQQIAAKAFSGAQRALARNT